MTEVVNHDLNVKKETELSNTHYTAINSDILIHNIHIHSTDMVMMLCVISMTTKSLLCQYTNLLETSRLLMPHPE